jgi:hypothetical protein
MRARWQKLREARKLQAAADPLQRHIKKLTAHSNSRFVEQASQAAEKLKNAVILSEAKNLSLFVLLCLNRREILRFAQNDRASQDDRTSQNDRTRHFFRNQ